jgi:heat shock protein HslJ
MIFDRRAGMAAIALTTLFSTTAIASPAAAQRGSASALAASHWDLEAWSGGQAPKGKRLRLDFDARSGRFSTETMCNSARGTYRVKGNTIRLGDGKGFATTLMACPEPAMSHERAYTSSLAAVRSWRITGDRLVLRTARGETLTYRAAHKPAANAPRKFIYVSAETKPCTGVAPMTCLQVREKESDPWQLHYGGIVDFTPQPGIEYRLRIIEEKVARPPADSSSIRWTLDQVIEQRVVKR